GVPARRDPAGAALPDRVQDARARPPLRIDRGDGAPDDAADPLHELVFDLGECCHFHRDVLSRTPYRSTTSRDGSRAMSAAGSTSSTQPPVFHDGTGVLHSLFGTNFERCTSWYLWM